MTYDGSAPDTVPEPPQEYGDIPPDDSYGPPPDDSSFFTDGEYAPRQAGEMIPRQRRPARRRKGEPERIEDLSTLVLDTLRKVLAALHRRPTSDALNTVQSIQAYPKVLSQLPEGLRNAYEGVFEVLLHECVNNPSGTLNMGFLPVAREYDEVVKTELAAITALSEKVVDEEAASLWSALKETVQRRYSLKAVEEFSALVRSKATVEELVAAHKAVTQEPPTARKALTATKPVKSAREIAAEHKALAAVQDPIRFSSGYRTLDLVFTGKGQPIGFLAPGEQTVVAGMTGTGKSSFSYGCIVGMTQDLINWGFPDGKVVWYHTEEESADKLHAAGFDEGQRYHHLAENVIVDPVGTSRRRVVEVLYTLTQEAHHLSLETGRTITQFLPHIVMLDYIQSLTSEKAQDPVTESIISAELILRGIQAWNFEELAKWGEVSYQEYTGETVPPGMEHHRVAVVTFAQLNKQDDNKMSFKPSSKEHPMSDFSIEDTRDNPAWRDAGGSGWAWEVKEGDSRILRQNTISGSSVILKNATTILFLHRSRPYNNPEAKDPVTGKGTGRLEDARARLIPDKTRTGSRLKHVPMEFDIDENGFRARYYDRAAEKAISDGRFTPDQSWRQPGDPIVPRRPTSRPLAGVRY